MVTSSSPSFVSSVLDHRGSGIVEVAVSAVRTATGERLSSVVLTPMPAGVDRRLLDPEGHLLLVDIHRCLACDRGQCFGQRESTGVQSLSHDCAMARNCFLCNGSRTALASSRHFSASSTYAKPLRIVAPPVVVVSRARRYRVSAGMTSWNDGLTAPPGRSRRRSRHATPRHCRCSQRHCRNVDRPCPPALLRLRSGKRHLHGCDPPHPRRGRRDDRCLADVAHRTSASAPARRCWRAARPWRA